LPRREDKADGKAERIHHGVDLGAQSSTRATDGVIRAPFTAGRVLVRADDRAIDQMQRLR
jgi:hypothetical protein